MTGFRTAARTSTFSRKELGRYRRPVLVALATLLVFGVVPAVSVVVAQAQVVPAGPAFGELKICKVAGVGMPVGTPFTFKVDQGALPIVNVPAGPAPGGDCVLEGSELRGSTVTITEVIPHGDQVTSIKSNYPTVGAPNLSTGTVHAQIGLGFTEVTYTDVHIPTGNATGYLEICKNVPSGPGVAGTPFSFTVQTQTVSVPAGACSPAIQVLVPALTSQVNVTEAPAPGFHMTGCSTLPTPNKLLSCAPTEATATVQITPGGISSETILTVTNGVGDPTPQMTWTTGAASGEAHLEGAAVAVGSLVYDISGANADCTDLQSAPTTSAVDIYNPATNTWAPHQGAARPFPIPNPRQDSPLAVALGTNIYVMGGTSTCLGASASTVLPVDVYHTATNTWTTLNSPINLLPPYLSSAWPSYGFAGFLSGAAIGSDIYVFGPTDIGMFDTTTNSWSEIVPPAGSPPLSAFSEAVTVGNQIEIVTGDAMVSSPLAHRILDFNPAGDTLTLEPATTIGWAEESTVLLNDKIVSVSGDFNGQNQVQIITGNTVVTDNSLVPNDIRDDAEGGSVVNGRVYIVGGQIGGASGSTNPPVLIGSPNW
jgi:hypothetical protein